MKAYMTTDAKTGELLGLSTSQDSLPTATPSWNSKTQTLDTPKAEAWVLRISESAWEGAQELMADRMPAKALKLIKTCSHSIQKVGDV